MYLDFKTADKQSLKKFWSMTMSLQLQLLWRRHYDGDDGNDYDEDDDDCNRK